MIFVDTVAWLYLFDENQTSVERKKARAFAKSAKQAFCTSDPVVAETYKWLIHHGRPATTAQKVLRLFVAQELAVLVSIEQQDREHAQALLQQYGDQKLSYEDAVTAAQMYRLGIKKIFSFDKHFLLFPGIERVPG